MLGFTDRRRDPPLSDLHGDESGVPYVERGGVDMSTCVPLKYKSHVVPLHVCHERAFRRVHRLWARGKNATAYISRAMQCMSCG